MRATTVAALCASAVMAAGCDDSLPTAPTPELPSSFANRLDSIPPLPEPAGRYTITLVAASACSQLPLAIRSRTLTGLVSPTGDWWPHDQPVIERVGPNSVMTLVGTVHAPVITSPAAFTAAFDGTISFCSASTPPTSNDDFPTLCGAPVECRSDRHQIRFVRR